MGVVCCQAVLAQGARPSQPGPRSRAAAQKHIGGGARCGGGGVEEETLLKRCVVPELHSGQASSVWGAAASPGPPFSSPLAGEPGPPHKTWRKGRGWRIKRLFFWWGGWNLPNMTKRWFVCWLVVNSVGEGGCRRVVGGGRVEGEMGGCGGAFARPYE